MELNIHEESLENALLLKLSGELNLHTCKNLDKEIDSLPPEEKRSLILDLCDLTSLDSRGLGSIVRSYNLLNKTNRGLLVLITNDDTSPQVLHPIQISNLTKLIPCFSDLSMASKHIDQTFPQEPPRALHHPLTLRIRPFRMVLVGERRRFPRCYMQMEGILKDHDQEKPLVIRNLSASGMEIQMDNPLPVLNEIEVSFYLPGEPQPIYCHGQIVRCCQAGSFWQQLLRRKQFFYLGVDFIYISNEDREKIINFVKNNT